MLILGEFVSLVLYFSIDMMCSSLANSVRRKCATHGTRKLIYSGSSVVPPGPTFLLGRFHPNGVVSANHGLACSQQQFLRKFGKKNLIWFSRGNLLFGVYSVKCVLCIEKYSS